CYYTGLSARERRTPGHTLFPYTTLFRSLWQQRQLRVRGKGGPYGKMTKVRVVTMSRRVRALLEHYYALDKEFPVRPRRAQGLVRSEEHTSELQSLAYLVCRLLLEKKNAH